MMLNKVENEGSISFILPIFNVDRYLKKCLDSIAQQDSNHWEAILVDDGSTDNSAEICKLYSENNSKFRYFRQANQGQGSARNKGLTLASGTYVCFVDPDDWINIDTTRVLLELMNDSDADFANFGIEFVTSDGNVERKICHFKDEVLTGRSIFHKALLDSEIYTSPCNKIYRASFLKKHGIQFPHLRAYEDVFFSRKLSLHADKCLFIEKILYHALIRGDSTTRTLNPKKITQAVEVISLEKATFIDSNTTKRELEIFNAHILKFTTYMIFQAAFRVATRDDYNICVAAMQSASRQALREAPFAARQLSMKNRIMTYIAFRPTAAFWCAKILRSLGFKPY